MTSVMIDARHLGNFKWRRLWNGWSSNQHRVYVNLFYRIVSCL